MSWLWKSWKTILTHLSRPIAELSNRERQGKRLGRCQGEEIKSLEISSPSLGPLNELLGLNRGNLGWGKRNA